VRKWLAAMTEMIAYNNWNNCLQRMNERYDTPQNVILCICACRTLIDRTKAAHVAAALREAGHRVTVQADLCREVMRNRCDSEALAQGTLFACYPRAVRSLLQWKGMGAKAYVDMRNGELKELCAQIGALPETTDTDPLETADTAPLEIEAPDGASAAEEPEAWFPIIDKERCTECGKCHDFCLFGVYAKTAEGQVRVVQPQSCKNNCPACARVCPSRAIIFPKYGKSPINGGEADEEQFTPQEADRMYRERLRYKLQQRSAGIPLTKADVTLSASEPSCPPSPV
jgi:NAD-dependent dihydropyrimidine dehydrogenase PreA subunit